MEKRIHRCVAVVAVLLATTAAIAGAWTLVPLYWRWQLLGVDLHIPIARQLVTDPEAARDLEGLLRSACARSKELQREDVPDDCWKHAAVRSRIVREICAWIAGHPRCEAVLTAKLIVANELCSTYGGSRQATMDRLHESTMKLLDEISEEHPATWQSAVARFYGTYRRSQWHSNGEGPNRGRLFAGGKALLRLAEEDLPPVPPEAFGLLDAWYVRPDFWRKPLRRMMLLGAGGLQLEAVMTIGNREGRALDPEAALLDDAERTWSRFIAEYPDDPFVEMGKNQLQRITELHARPEGPL